MLQMDSAQLGNKSKGHGDDVCLQVNVMDCKEVFAISSRVHYYCFY